MGCWIDLVSNGVLIDLFDYLKVVFNLKIFGGYDVFDVFKRFLNFFKFVVCCILLGRLL